MGGRTDEARSEEPRSRGSGALALLIAGWALLAWSVRFCTDDAYISFRYARNWAEGHGLRYNLGEHVPVEGFSNLLWTAISALVLRLGGDPVTWMPALSFACGGVLLWRVFAVLRRESGTRVATLATATLAASAPFAVWSTGGLETMSFALLLFVVFELAVLRPERRAAWGLAGLAGAAAALSRPEGVYWVLLLLALAVVVRRRRGERSRPALFLLVLLPPVVLGFAWRLQTFGHALPTSATAKLSAGLGADRLARGLSYVVLELLTTLSLFALVPAGVAALRSRRPERLAALAMAAGFPVWAIVVSGDFMAFGRFLVPGLPFLAVLVGGWLASVRRAAPVVAATLVVLGLLPAFDVHPVPESVRARFDVRPHLDGFRSEHAYWNQQRRETLRWADRGEALAQIASPGDSIVLSAIGAVGYHSRLFVFDRVGLVTREVAELPPTGDAREATPGHDNPVPVQWFLDRGHTPTFVRANFHTVEELSELGPKAAKSLDQLETVGLADDYFLDVFRVEHDPPEPGLRYFFVWRHVPGGRARQAQRSLDQRLQGHVAGGDLRTIRLGPRRDR